MDPAGGEQAALSAFMAATALGHLWFLQGQRPFRRGFQGHRQGTAGFGLGGPGRHRDKNGIGYSGMGYRTSGVKALASPPKAAATTLRPTP